MKILTRFEGGLGDCLLANRFLHAIKEKYPYDNIRVLFDTDNNPKQEKVMCELWPNLYQDTKTLSNRKDKNFKFQTMLGEETYPAHLNNMPDEFNEELKNCDKFYDLHIDGLKWLNYDFDWLRYYYYFPRPYQQVCNPHNYDLPNKFILMHMFARPDSPYNLERQYTYELISKLKETIPVVVICNKEYFDHYDGLDIKLIDPSFTECFDVASKCEMFIGMDSGIRYIPYHYSKPTFVFSNFCRKYGQVHPAQLIRWLIFEKNVLPFNCSIDNISLLINNVLDNKAYCLFPHINKNVKSMIYQRDL